MSGVYRDYWWIPIVGPLIGAVIGILVYDLFIGDVLVLRAKDEELPEAGVIRQVETTEE